MCLRMQPVKYEVIDAILNEPSSLCNFRRQNSLLVKNLTTDPMALIHPNIKRITFRPNLSDNPPMATLDMATPINVVMGRKYVAELKPNGSVLGKEPSFPLCSYGVHFHFVSFVRIDRSRFLDYVRIILLLLRCIKGQSQVCIVVL